MIRPLASLLALVWAVAGATYQAPSAAKVDAAFGTFFDARSAAETGAAIEQIVASGIGVGDARARLKRGRVYSGTVARGVVQASYRRDSVEYFYTLDVPQTYDPARAYQVRVQLH